MTESTPEVEVEVEVGQPGLEPAADTTPAPPPIESWAEAFIDRYPELAVLADQPLPPDLLPVRLRYRVAVQHWEDLLLLSVNDLRSIPNVGTKTVDELLVQVDRIAEAVRSGKAAVPAPAPLEAWVEDQAARTLEDEMEALLIKAYMAAHRGKAPTPEWATALSMRAGIHGEVATLEEAAQAIGVTRERVRQVADKVNPHLRGARLSRLLPVAEQLVQNSPVIEPIGRLGSESGLTRPTLTAKALLNFFKLIGTTPKELVGTNLLEVDGWLVEESEAGVMSALSMAKKHTSSHGMTTIEEIRQELSETYDEVDTDDIVRVLTTEPSVKWHGEWLWVEKEDNLHSNRLINTVRSILSVNSPQTVASIHEGCRRLWKFRKVDILPPVEAMRGFLDESPHFTVEDDLVDLVQPLDYHEILGDVALTVVEVLKSTPHGIMDRLSLEEACIDAGVAKGTIAVWSTYAEWLELVARNVLGLRGSNPNPAAVKAVQEAAAARKKAEPHRRSWAWGSNGELVQTLHITTTIRSSGVMTLSNEVRTTVAGKSFSVIVGTEQVGVIKIDNGFCWGWHAVFTALGAKQGDVLQIRFDLAGGTANVRIDGNELWD